MMRTSDPTYMKDGGVGLREGDLLKGTLVGDDLGEPDLDLDCVLDLDLDMLDLRGDLELDFRGDTERDRKWERGGVLQGVVLCKVTF